MPNTINKEAVLSARLAVLLQEPTLWEDMANTDYQGEIDEQGDTVKVQNFPIVEWDVQSGVDAQEKGGEDIGVTNWALGKSSLTVDQVAHINLKIKDIEKEISNLNLEKGLLVATAQGSKRARSRFIRDLAVSKAGNVVDDGAGWGCNSNNWNSTYLCT